jgi:hypothetical protein
LNMVFAGITPGAMASILGAPSGSSASGVYGAKDIAISLKSIYSLDIASVAIELKKLTDRNPKLLDNMHGNLGSIPLALRDAFQATPQAVAIAMVTASYSIGSVYSGLQNGLGIESPRELGALLAGAAFNHDQMLSLDVLHSTPRTYQYNYRIFLAEMLAGAGNTVEIIAGDLKNTMQLTPQNTVGALRVANFTIEQISGALKTVYLATPQVAAIALKNAVYQEGPYPGAGYRAMEVAGVLKNVFGATKNDASAALTVAGYTASDVTAAITSAFP